MFHGEQCGSCLEICLWFVSSCFQLSVLLAVCFRLQFVSSVFRHGAANCCKGHFSFRSVWVRVRVTLHLAVYSNRFVLTPTQWDPQPVFFQLNTCGYIPYVTSSVTRGLFCRLKLRLVLASAVILGVQVPLDPWPYFTFSNSRLTQAGGPVRHSYIPQKQGGQVIPPGTRFLFRRLLWLAGVRWRHSTPHSHRLLSQSVYQVKVKIKVRVTSRLAVYRHSVRLGIKPLENHDQRYF
jgi:hypothetical protein